MQAINTGDQAVDLTQYGYSDEQVCMNITRGAEENSSIRVIKGSQPSSARHISQDKSSSQPDHVLDCPKFQSLRSDEL